MTELKTELSSYRRLLRARIAARRTFLVACGAFVLSMFFESNFLSMVSFILSFIAVVAQLAAIEKEVPHG